MSTPLPVFPPLDGCFQVYTLNVTNLDTLAVTSHWSDALLGLLLYQERDAGSNPAARESGCRLNGRIRKRLSYFRRPIHPDRMLFGTTH